VKDDRRTRKGKEKFGKLAMEYMLGRWMGEILARRARLVLERLGGR
jgi:hypothetical protein